MIKQAQDLLALSEYVNNLFTNNNNLMAVNENLREEIERLRSENEKLRNQIPSERDKKIETVIDRAVAYMDIDIEYIYGGTYTKNKAFDCSSFVRACFYPFLGLNLPRASRDQAEYGHEVAEEDILRGDTLFFDTNGDGVINHVGIYLGDGKMIHTAVPGEDITIDDWKQRYRRLIVARRYL